MFDHRQLGFRHVRYVIAEAVAGTWGRFGRPGVTLTNVAHLGAKHHPKLGGGLQIQQSTTHGMGPTRPRKEICFERTGEKCLTAFMTNKQSSTIRRGPGAPPLSGASNEGSSFPRTSTRPREKASSLARCRSRSPMRHRGSRGQESAEAEDDAKKATKSQFN